MPLPTSPCSPISECELKKIWSINPLERLNQKVKRHTDVVGVFAAGVVNVAFASRVAPSPTKYAATKYA